MNARFRIFVAEDNEADVLLVQTALEEAGLDFELQVCSEGDEVVRRLEQIGAGEAPPPDLLLLDLNLPKYSGEEILERFRQNAKCASIPAIVITSSNSPRDRARADALGATYFRKSADLAEFMKLGELIRHELSVYESRENKAGNKPY